MLKAKNARGNIIPPFFAKRKCETDKQNKIHVKSVFATLWFHCMLEEALPESDNADCEKLVLWKDLLAANHGAARKDLQKLVLELFAAQSGQNARLRAFLHDCLRIEMA